MRQSSNKDNICPNIVVSSDVSPEQKETIGMDEAALDVVAAQEFSERAKKLQRRIDNLSWSHLGPTIKKAQALRTRIKDADAEDYNTLALHQEYDAVMDDVERLYEALYAIVAEALDWRYTGQEVQGWFTRALEMGCPRPQVGSVLLENLMYVRKIPTAPFRQRVEELRAAGLQVPTTHDTPLENIGNSMEQVAGVKPRGNGSMVLWITYEQGLVMARLLGMSPQEAGI